MIKSKQIQGLEELESNVLVSVEQDTDGAVTLTRSDGFSLSFAAGDGTIGEKGDKGPKGDKGFDGLSAYELAVLQGYNDIEEAWRESFKGDKGEPGIDGINGTNGSDGTTVTFNDNVTVTKGEAPFVMVGYDNTLTFSFPNIKQGATGASGQRYQISSGSIEESDNVFAVRTSWDNYDGNMVITLPVGKQGNKGAPGTTVNKTSPTLDSVNVSTILVPGASWKCTGGGRKDQNGYSFDLAPAADGLQGAQGDEGLPGAVIGDLDINNEELAVGFSSFGITDNGIEIRFQFDSDSNASFGFDINNNDISFNKTINNVKEEEQ